MPTIRQEIMDLLGEEELNAMDLSQLLGIPEKEVFEHLEHVARTAKVHGRKFIIQPFLCLKCGFSFKDRNRLSRPGRCPRCRESHIRMATYSIR